MKSRTSLRKVSGSDSSCSMVCFVLFFIGFIIPTITDHSANYTEKSLALEGLSVTRGGREYGERNTDRPAPLTYATTDEKTVRSET